MPAPPATTFMLGRQRVDLYDKGHGPAVLLLHELPGLSRATLNLVDRLVADGYHVYYPRLFGDYGETQTGPALPLSVCRNGEFHCLSKDVPAAPLIKFIRESVFPKMRSDGATQTVVIGMCLTGSVGVALLNDDLVRGAVMSQPALPFALGRSRLAALGLTDDEIKDAKASHKPILAFRFTNDCISPPERMEHFEHVFGPQMTVMQIDSSPCNAAGVPGNSHAVLTLSHHPSEPHYPTNDAMTALEEFLNRTLRSTH